MSTVLEITQLDNGDIVLREAGETGEPLLRICFSDEVQDMLGDEIIAVAEAMIDAATDFLSDESVYFDAAPEGGIEVAARSLKRPPVIH
jgi:hypothetical protein